MMKVFLVLFLLFCFKSEACPKAFKGKNKDDKKFVLANTRWIGLTLNGFDAPRIDPHSSLAYRKQVNQKFINKFKGAIFTGGYFPNSYLGAINARKGEFSNTDFSYSEFYDVILERTIFIKSILSYMWWTEVNARGMDATGAIFKKSTFRKVDFSDSILYNTDFTKVTFKNGVKFNENTNIEGAKFLGAKIYQNPELVKYFKSKGFKVKKREKKVDEITRKTSGRQYIFIIIGMKKRK